MLLHYYHICYLFWIRYLYLYEVFTFTLMSLVVVISMTLFMMFIFMYPTYHQIIWLCHTPINENMCIQLIDLSQQCRYYKYWFNNDTIYSLYMSINIFNLSFGPHYTFFFDFWSWDKHISSIWQQIIVISSYMVPLWRLRKRITGKNLNKTRKNWTFLSI